MQMYESQLNTTCPGLIRCCPHYYHSRDKIGRAVTCSIALLTSVIGILKYVAPEATSVQAAKTANDAKFSNIGMMATAEMIL